MASCTDGKWYVTNPPSCSGADPKCPAVAPKPGDFCKGPTDPSGKWNPCVWKNECGGYDWGVCGWITGDPDAWTVVRGACPDRACPTTPVEGAACTGERTCSYPLGGGCRLDCACSGGSWACTQPPCE
jgi:hypothetical protein